MPYAAAIIGGIAAISAAVSGGVISSRSSKRAANMEQKALDQAKMEAIGISEQERKDTQMANRYNRERQDRADRETIKSNAISRRLTLDSEQRNRVSELANTVQSAIAKDSLFKNSIRQTRR
jgi:hypothetical protein